MRLLRFVAFALLLAACQTTTASETQVSSAQAHELVSKGALLLDVRTPQEYQRGHVDNARNIPIDVLQDRLSELPKDQPIVVYCQSGKRSARAVSMLKGAGFSQIYDLGGIANW